jgi:hypothetical protein
MAPAHKVIGWLVKASGSSGTAVTWELDERAYQRPVLIREFGRLLYSTRSTVESWEIGPSAQQRCAHRVHGSRLVRNEDARASTGSARTEHPRHFNARSVRPEALEACGEFIEPGE